MRPSFIGALHAVRHDKDYKKYHKINLQVNKYKQNWSQLNDTFKPQLILDSIKELEILEKERSERIKEFGDIQIICSQDQYYPGEVVKGMVMVTCTSNTLKANEVKLRVKMFQLYQLTGIEFNEKQLKISNTFELNNTSVNKSTYMAKNNDIIEEHSYYNHTFKICDEDAPFPPQETFYIPFEFTLYGKLPRTCEVIDRQISIITLLKLQVQIPISENEYLKKNLELKLLQKPLQLIQNFNNQTYKSQIASCFSKTNVQYKVYLQDNLLKPGGLVEAKLVFNGTDRQNLPYSGLKIQLDRLITLNFDNLNKTMKTSVFSTILKFNQKDIVSIDDKYLEYHFSFNLPDTFLNLSVNDYHYKLNYNISVYPAKLNFCCKEANITSKNHMRIYIHSAEELPNDEQQIKSIDLNSKILSSSKQKEKVELQIELQQKMIEKLNKFEEEQDELINAKE